MKFIENINEIEFNNFVKKNCSTFMQTSYFGEINKFKNLNYHLVGLEDNNKILATAMILEKKLIKNITYLYIPRGFVTDFNNKTIVNTFINELKKFGKKRKAIFISIDPEIILKIDNKEQNINLNLKNYGFKHLGFNYYFENRQPRFTYCLNLKDNYINNFHATTKKIYNKGNLYNLEISKGNKDNIKDFYNLMLETGIRNDVIFFCCIFNTYR